MLQGMRVTEIISLNVSDIDIESSLVTCKNENKQKNNSPWKIIFISIKEYMTIARPNMIKDDNETALFVNVNGKKD